MVCLFLVKINGIKWFLTLHRMFHKYSDVSLQVTISKFQILFQSLGSIRDLRSWKNVKPGPKWPGGHQSGATTKCTEVDGVLERWSQRGGNTHTKQGSWRTVKWGGESKGVTDTRAQPSTRGPLTGASANREFSGNWYGRRPGVGWWELPLEPFRGMGWSWFEVRDASCQGQLSLSLLF